MKPVKSPLNIIDFAILKLEYEFIQPEESENSLPSNYFEDYELDIDFGIHGKDFIQVFIKAEINKEKLPGYRISIETACVFDLDKNVKLEENAKSNIEGFSTIYIALNVMRTYISQVTANGPMGKYILPSIDLNELINQKKQMSIEKSSNKSGIKKTKLKKEVTKKAIKK